MGTNYAYGYGSYAETERSIVSYFTGYFSQRPHQIMH